MLQHTLLSGEVLEAPTPTAALAAFLQRLRAAVDDPTLDEGGFISLLYSPENPLLDATVMPGRGTVTKAAFANPIYHLMLDLLGRKRVELGSLDMYKVRARYSMTVKEAAEHAGVHENAIRQAIAAKRLSSVKLKGEHRLDPKQVEMYKPAQRGRAAPLAVVYGSAPDKRLSIKHNGALVEDGREANVKRGHIDGWSRAGVLAGTKDKVRFWLIEKGSEPNVIGFDDFSVRGRFNVVDVVNNPISARASFREFDPDLVMKADDGSVVVAQMKAARGRPVSYPQQRKRRVGIATKKSGGSKD